MQTKCDRAFVPSIARTSSVIAQSRTVHPYESVLAVWSCIFTARRSYASAVLGVIILSVCPSVTRMLCN